MASRSRSADGNETWLTRFFAASEGTPVEGGDPAREGVDEAVQFGVWKCPVDVSVSFRGVAIEVVGAEHDFQGAATADQLGEAFGTPAATMDSHSDLRMAESRVLARRESHVAREEGRYLPDEPFAV